MAPVCLIDTIKKKKSKNAATKKKKPTKKTKPQRYISGKFLHNANWNPILQKHRQSNSKLKTLSEEEADSKRRSSTSQEKNVDTVMQEGGSRNQAEPETKQHERNKEESSPDLIPFR